MLPFYRPAGGERTRPRPKWASQALDKFQVPTIAAPATGC